MMQETPNMLELHASPPSLAGFTMVMLPASLSVLALFSLLTLLSYIWFITSHIIVNPPFLLRDILLGGMGEAGNVGNTKNRNPNLQ